jgi:hypothetical protein
MIDKVIQLEKNIHKLKTAYDQYFLGVDRRPPEKLAADVARDVRFLTTTRLTNTATRFRSQQAIARYNTFLQYWQKNLKDLEEGRTPRRRIAAVGGMQHESVPGVIEISATGQNREGMERLFSALSKEYRKTDNGNMPEMSKLREMVHNQTQSLRKSHNCDAVTYRVVSEDGKVKIKASPVTRRKV